MGDPINVIFHLTGASAYPYPEGPLPIVPPRKTRHRLSVEMRENIQSYFQEFIIEKRCPQKAHCLAAQQRFPELKAIQWKTVKWAVRSMFEK